MKIPYFFLLADSVFGQGSQWKKDPKATCPSGYIFDTGSNKCELNNLSGFTWTCNADASITFKQLHADYVIKNYSSSGQTGPLSLISEHEGCRKTSQQVTYQSSTHIFSDFTIKESDLCPSNLKHTNAQTIIEYKITVDDSSSPLPQKYSITVGCGFSKSQTVSKSYNLQSEAVSNSGTSGGVEQTANTNFGASIMKVESLDPASGLELGTTTSPVRIGQRMSFKIQLPTYLSGFDAKMRLEKCLAKSKTVNSPLSPAVLYDRVCPTTGNGIIQPKPWTINDINFILTHDAVSSNNWRMTFAEMKFDAFYLDDGDVSNGITIECNVKICHKLDTTCNYLCP